MYDVNVMQIKFYLFYLESEDYKRTSALQLTSAYIEKSNASNKLEDDFFKLYYYFL